MRIAPLLVRMEGRRDRTLVPAAARGGDIINETVIAFRLVLQLEQAPRFPAMMGDAEED